VPGSYGKNRFSYEHHKAWDDFVKQHVNGLTILKGAKGEWISPCGKLYVDKVIPVRIACSQEVISIIMSFTILHYDQEAVFAYEISNNVIVKYKEND
jgi:hypothetical protein